MKLIDFGEDEDITSKIRLEIEGLEKEKEYVEIRRILQG